MVDKIILKKVKMTGFYYAATPNGKKKMVCKMFGDYGPKHPSGNSLYPTIAVHSITKTQSR